MGTMTLKFLDFEKYYDYGWEFFFQFLTIPKKFALLDLTLQWDDYGRDEIFPAFYFSIGPNRLCAFSFRWGRFEIQCDIIDFHPRDLEWYKGTYD